MSRKALLFDTCVLMDLFNNRRAGHEVAGRLLDAVIAGDHKLLVTSGSLKDCYYLMVAGDKAAARAQGLEVSSELAAASEAVAASLIEKLTELAVVVPTDHNATRMALKLRGVHRDLEDNLVIAAAMRAGDCILVTNDSALLQHSPVAALTPADALEVLEIE